LLHPGKLVRAMVDTLPKNVDLYENSSLSDWSKEKDFINCKFRNSTIKTKKIIFATNGFLRSLDIKKTIIFQLRLLQA
jgi:glycine/D-amino acid oxidase-like deaminating enzyme